MSRYDGLIIPRSYSEYINKTDAATLLQALQLSGVMDNAPTAGSNHPVKSSGIYTANRAFRCVRTIDVNSNIQQNISFGTWGYGLVMGNIDGAGNFAFFISRSGTPIAINNLTLGTGYTAATLNENTIVVGNKNAQITITVEVSNINIKWTGTNTSPALHCRASIISGDTSL